MPAVTLSCSTCSYSMKVPDCATGQDFYCPSCGRLLQPPDVRPEIEIPTRTEKTLAVFAFVLGLLHIIWGGFLLYAFLGNSFEGQQLLRQLGFRGEGLAFIKVLPWSFLGFVLGSLSLTAGFSMLKRRPWVNDLGPGILSLILIISAAVFWIAFLVLIR